MNPIHYFKKTTRTGMAFTTDHGNNIYTYTNRRGETVGINRETFDAKWAEGYNTPGAREVKEGKAVKKEVAGPVVKDVQRLVAEANENVRAERFVWEPSDLVVQKSSLILPGQTENKGSLILL